MTALKARDVFLERDSTRRARTERRSASDWEFADKLGRKPIRVLGNEPDEVRKARDSWLESKRGRLTLSATGIAVGEGLPVFSVFVALLTPIVLATAGLGLVSGTAIAGGDWLLDWRNGKKGAQKNGRHYWP